MGFQVQTFLVICLGASSFELVSAQFVAQFSGLLLAASAEFIFILVLGAYNCLSSWSSVPRFLSAGPNCTKLVFSSPILYRKINARWHELPISILCRVLGPVRHPHGWGSAVVCWFVVAGFNLVGLWIALYWLNRERPHLLLLPSYPSVIIA